MLSISKASRSSKASIMSAFELRCWHSNFISEDFEAELEADESRPALDLLEIIANSSRMASSSAEASPLTEPRDFFDVSSDSS